MYQERYWKELYQLKVHINYLEIYVESSNVIDRNINIFLAITSSSSICGWAIWQQYSFIWGALIATSQLITAIKSFLPYKSRIKSISSLRHEFEELALQCELKWFDVSEGNLTEEEIHKLQFEIRKKKLQLLKKNFGATILPTKSKFLDKARTITDVYFKNFYS